MRSIGSIGIALLAACALVAPAAAQLTEKRALTLDGAKRIVAAAAAQAKAAGAPGAVIAVVDDGGNLMVAERLDGTFPAGASISIGKARTAAIFKHETRFFEDVINKGRTAMTALSDFTPLQGGVPIELDGQVIGGIGVSGAASAAQDEEVALAGARAISEIAAKSASHGDAVAYFPHDDVAAAFSKGAVLFDGNGGQNYMVHASRRDKPGQAEVHARDTDIIYALDGSVTFVTGGELVDASTTAPDEIRGGSIRGGESRKLAKGDVIIVPSGTPHWFKDVPGPFTYYVVKVR